MEIKSISRPVGARCIVIRALFFTSHLKTHATPNRMTPRTTKTKIVRITAFS